MVRYTKEMASMERLGLHCSGCLVWGGPEDRVHLKVSPPMHHNNANMHCTMLMDIIRQLAALNANKPWPEVLYIQLDNCGKDNKVPTILFFTLLIHSFLQFND
jgi:hypothetical protein